jgi:hypothetical protein
MARGWESKSVEDQQSESRPRDRRNDGPTREELERTRRLESLEMQRRRVSHDLETSHSDVHRAALRNALQFLDDELGKLR